MSKNDINRQWIIQCKEVIEKKDAAGLRKWTDYKFGKVSQAFVKLFISAAKEMLNYESVKTDMEKNVFLSSLVASYENNPSNDYTNKDIPFTGEVKCEV